jgi:hypothetical protein
MTPTRAFDMGEGRGRRVTREIEGGVVGIIVDARGRPLLLPESRDERARRLSDWEQALGVYPEIRAE